MSSNQSFEDIQTEADAIRQTAEATYTEKLNAHTNGCKANASYINMNYWITRFSTILFGAAAYSDNVRKYLITLVTMDTVSVGVGLVCRVASIFTNSRYMNNGPTRWQKIPKI